MLEVGNSYEIEFSFTQEQVNDFCKISGDFNPLHWDEAYAATTPFKKPIIHGALIGISIGSHACTAALKAYGNIRRIAFFSPYYPVANAEVRRYFADAGYETVRDAALRAPSWTAIAQIPESRCREVLRELDGPDVDAILQVGTNLSMVRLAGEAEQWLGKPVIAINTATYWHALRANGVDDRMSGFGRLLSDF